MRMLKQITAAVATAALLAGPAVSNGAPTPRSVPGTFGAATAAIRSADPLALQRALQPPLLSEHVDGHVNLTGRAWEPRPAGDLDGDGDADIVAWAVDVSSNQVEFTLGLDGGTGAELWRVDGHAYVMPMGDADGDGGADVLFVSAAPTRAEEQPCLQGIACEHYALVSYEYTVAVRSGADGTVIWSETIPGSGVASQTLDDGQMGTVNVLLQHGTNVSLFADPTGDHDGDGRADLIVQTFDLNEVDPFLSGGGSGAAMSAGSDGRTITTRARLVSPASGDLILARVDPARAGMSLLLPAGDATGDGTGDLMWTTETDPNDGWACVYGAGQPVCHGTPNSDHTDSTLDVELIDGESLATAWRARVVEENAWVTFISPTRADLDGDGGEELAIRDFDARAITFVSGASGAPMWSLASMSFDPIGPVVGGPGSDIVRASEGSGRRGAARASGTILEVARIHGVSGNLIFSSHHDLSDAHSPTVLTLGDVDRDGVLDLVVSLTSNEGVRSHAVESGRTGHTLSESPSSRQSYLEGAGDLDGADGDDVILTSYADDRSSIRLQATLMPAGATAWQRIFPATQSTWMDPTQIGDSTGDGRADLVVAHARIDGETVLTGFGVLDGTTGTTAWQVGEAIL